MDGDELFLPADGDLYENDFRGHPHTKVSESHFPKMFSVQVLDVINSLVCRFTYGKRIGSELEVARGLVKTLEPNSIAIYDRYHCNHTTFETHVNHGSYFLVRAKTKGKTAPNPIRKFLASSLRDMNVDWYPVQKKEGVPPLKLRLVKIKNTKTGKTDVFVTNLSKNMFSRKELGQFYLKRWEIETSFRDITSTFQLDQWHSKKLNGILQEIYALLWMFNAVKTQMNSLGNKTENLFDKEYARANFKLCASLVIQNIDLLWTGRKDELLELLRFWINRTREKREHRSRSYPRAVRRWGKMYASISKVKRQHVS